MSGASKKQQKSGKVLLIGGRPHFNDALLAKTPGGSHSVSAVWAALFVSPHAQSSVISYRMTA